MNQKAARTYRQMKRARGQIRNAEPDGDPRADRRAAAHTVHAPRDVKAIYSRMDHRARGRQRAAWSRIALENQS